MIKLQSLYCSIVSGGDFLVPRSGVSTYFDVDTLLKDDFIYVYSSIISTVSLLLSVFIPFGQVCGWIVSAIVLPVQLSRC